MSSVSRAKRTANEVDQYLRDGVINLPSVLSKETVALLRDEADALVERIKLQEYGVSFFWGGKWLSQEEESSAIIHRVYSLETHSAAFAEALFECETLLSFLTEVVGPNVQLLETTLAIKQPFNEKPLRMHQDYPFFPHANHSPVVAMIPLDDATSDNGCLRVVKGSHTLGVLPHDATGHLLPGSYTLADGVPIESQAGSAVVFSCLTVHGSGQNHTSKLRRAFVIKVRNPEDVPMKQPEGVHVGLMLRGFNPLTSGKH